MKQPLAILAAGIVLCGTSLTALAEPYLALRQGVNCSSCHTNPTGGGKRNQFGRMYSQTVMPGNPSARPVDHTLNEYLDIGGNFRFGASAIDNPDEDNTVEFETQRSNLYLEATLVRDQMSLYLDQQFAPSGLNREMWALLYSDSRNAYLKAGKLFLPFGWRMEDDSSFVKATTGLNFLTSEDGIELGARKGAWSGQLAITNGAAGGAETNTGKRLTASTMYMQPKWRLGSSLSHNNSDDDERLMFALFSGAQIQGAEILLEMDWISDSSSLSEDRDQLATLFEINKAVEAGSNLKLTYEYLDPDLDIAEDERTRLSLVWELTPRPFLQVRIGTRQATGIPQNSTQNADDWFIKLHAWY